MQKHISGDRVAGVSLQSIVWPASNLLTVIKVIVRKLALRLS